MILRTTDHEEVAFVFGHEVVLHLPNELARVQVDNFYVIMTVHPERLAPAE
jgi:hypothetical protein